MKAVTQQEFGGAVVLQTTEMDAPAAIPTEVLVRVEAVGVNPIEPLIRAGVVPLLGSPPFVLGWDVSGVVEESHPNSWRFKPGDEVFGMPFFPRPASAYAEFLAAPAIQLVRKPASLDHVHAAALPLAGLTAWQALVDLARIETGQKVLIHGGGGGVGHIAVQIARLMGTQVFATASADKRDFLFELGADEVIDYHAEDFARAVSDVDVVLDLIGGDYVGRSLEVLRGEGMFVTAVERTNANLAAKVEKDGKRFAAVAVDPDHAALERLARLADEGQLRVHVETTFPMQDAPEAHKLVEGGHVKGKVVLTR